jgi:hypothetical protein
MAPFIVISADNRLHYLVDGIEKCRPQNPSTITNISTGKIIKGDSGYVYKYRVFSEQVQGDDSRTLSDLISNQLAAFRTGCNIPAQDSVNIFLLENILTEDDLNVSNSWVEEFKEVYRVSDKYFCLFRVAVTYDPEQPADVTRQVDDSVFRRLVEEHKNAIRDEDGFQRYLFYIGNQKFGAAALSLAKKEHDLKLPRILMDFMMLVSDTTGRYNIMQSIDKPSVKTNCFSIGYAESMYYYPDVERYYVHADNRDLLLRLLTDEDEKEGDIGENAMDIEKYPFGLRKRQRRLAPIYEDVPFSERTGNHPLSADKKIDDCIVLLKKYIDSERAAEIEEFSKSEQQEIGDLEAKIEQATHQEEESGEDLYDLKQKLQEKKEALEEKLKEKLSQFEPECPKYVDRNTIYEDVACEDGPTEEDASQYYNALIAFVLSKRFLDFVRNSAHSTAETEIETNQTVPGEDDTPRKKRCLLSRLFGWFKSLWRNPQNSDTAEGGYDEENESEETDNRAVSEGTTCILTIREQLRLKEKFQNFKREVYAIECEYDEEVMYCNDFKLTDHLNHYYHLIDLPKLKSEHASTSEQRISNAIKAWRDKGYLSKSLLVDSVKRKATEYTKRFSFIRWEEPFSFVSKLDAKGNMPSICNQLQRRADPFANYNPSVATNPNIVFRYMYSDRPDFDKEFNDDMKPDIDNSNYISAFQSSHIESKICFMEILPMDDDVLKCLILKDNSGVSIVAE